MRRPRLNALRTFEAAGRRLSFSRAAEELHITQAAVSQQIRQLESDLGAPLFHRRNRRITLTSAAAAYLPSVQTALEILDQATDRQFAIPRDRDVTIRCTSSIATQWLAPHLHGFHAAHPDITLHIRTLEGTGDNRSHCDIEVFCSRDCARAPGISALFDAIITPVAAPGQVPDTMHDPTELLGCDLIHVVGYDDDWHRWFATHLPGRGAAPGGLSVDSSLFAIDAALRGEGIHLGRRPFIDDHLKSGALVEVFDRPLHLHTTCFMRQSETGRHCRVVAEWIADLAAKTVPSTI